MKPELNITENKEYQHWFHHPEYPHFPAFLQADLQKCRKSQFRMRGWCLSSSQVFLV